MLLTIEEIRYAYLPIVSSSYICRYSNSLFRYNTCIWGVLSLPSYSSFNLSHVSFVVL